MGADRKKSAVRGIDLEKRTVIYYEDERNDEFSTAQITPKKIDGSWVYIHTSPFKRFTRFFWYRVVGTPLAFLYAKLVFHQKTVGREKLKPYRKTGYFLYGNHTQPTGDALFPPLIDFPKSNYVIVHPNNVSMPVLGRITPSLGALPLPDDHRAYRNFIRAVETRISEGCAVVIYPEAHIWPYYTGIRPFPDASFTYPAKLGVPVFCFTNTYRRRRFGRRPRIVTLIEGPFYPEKNRPVRENAAILRDRVYGAMKKSAETNEVERIRYVRKGADNG